MCVVEVKTIDEILQLFLEGSIGLTHFLLVFLWQFVRVIQLTRFQTIVVGLLLFNLRHFLASSEQMPNGIIEQMKHSQYREEHQYNDHTRQKVLDKAYSTVNSEKLAHAIELERTINSRQKAENRETKSLQKLAKIGWILDIEEANHKESLEQIE